MSDGTQLVITEAGLNAAINADKAGIQAKIKTVVVGDTGYTPNRSQKALVSPRASAEIGEYKNIGNQQIQAAAKFSGPEQYEIWGNRLSFGRRHIIWCYFST